MGEIEKRSTIQQIEEKLAALEERMLKELV